MTGLTLMHTVAHARIPGTPAPGDPWPAVLHQLPARPHQDGGNLSPTMVPTPARHIYIKGLTSSGRTFRPSDWAERLAGVMSPFGPGGGKSRIGSHIAYSPWCVPTVINGIKVVVVHTDLRDAEPMAWDFVMHFARDNDLQVSDTCEATEPPARQ